MIVFGAHWLYGLQRAAGGRSLIDNWKLCVRDPIVAVFLGWPIAHGTVSGRELLGAVIILAPVVVITIASVSAAPATSAMPSPTTVAPSVQEGPTVMAEYMRPIALMHASCMHDA